MLLEPNVDTEISNYFSKVGRRAAEAAGPYQLGERGSILPGRLAASVCLW